MGHSLLGVLRHTHPHVLENVDTLYRHTKLIAAATPIALITTQLSLDLNQPFEFAYAHAATALVPAICEVALPEQNDRALDIVIVGNVASLGYLAAMNEKYWAMGLSFLSALNHFSYKPICEHFDVPKIDLFTYGLGFFTIFAVNCLSEK